MDTERSTGAKSTQPTLLTSVAGELSMLNKELVDLLERVDRLGDRLFGPVPQTANKVTGGDGSARHDCLMDRVRQAIEEFKYTIGNLRVSVSRLEEL